MNPSASLFDDLAAQDGDGRHTLIDSAAVRASLQSDGIALTPPLLSEAECHEVRDWFADTSRFRSTVVMQRYGSPRHAMRHGTGNVTRGNRTVLGIIFHNSA